VVPPTPPVVKVRIPEAVVASCRRQLGGPSPTEFLKLGWNWGGQEACCLFLNAAYLKRFSLTNEETEAQGLEVTWLVLARLDLNFSL
jgi:hypothetical protein